ncbi:MAG: LysE family translocator [Acetobacteraceae bacterium]
MHPAAWIAFTLAYTVMALAPGPTILLVVSYALAHGRRTAIAVVAGTTLGDATCLTAAVFGLGAVLAASATAFTALKLAGAAYLVFLGIRLWSARSVSPATEAAPEQRSPIRIFGHAFLATALNPKSILFFMIFVPQFMDPHRAILPQLLAMLISVFICGAAVDGSYSMFAASLRRFTRAPTAQRAVNRTAGGLLISEGILAATWRALAL